MVVDRTKNLMSQTFSPELTSRVFLLTAFVANAMMLGSSSYQSAVDVPNWASALPDSSRRYASAALAHATPTKFYRNISIVAVLAGVASLVAAHSYVGWKVAVAFGPALSALLTVILVFPRNAILFFDPAGAHTAAAITTAAREWRALHAVRIALLASSVLCAALCLLG